MSNWFFERSSGYAGYRCDKCAIWIYADQIQVCNCNRKEIDLKIACIKETVLRKIDSAREEGKNHVTVELFHRDDLVKLTEHNFGKDYEITVCKIQPMFWILVALF